MGDGHFRPSYPTHEHMESRMRNPVKVVTRSTGNVVTDSTVSDHLSERSDAGVGFMSRGDQFG